jgi:riboflavin synthase
MFSGIIESVGIVSKSLKRGSLMQLEIKNKINFDDVKQGSSISVNGACLTVLDILKGKEGETYSFEVSNESCEKTNLRDLKKGSNVNLERSLRLDQRLEGHIVLGHVDSRIRVEKIVEESGGGKIFQFGFDKAMTGSFVEKGSAALNGVSLTVFNITDRSFKVVVLPYTFDKTNFHDLKTGDLVNCEADILGKYVHALMKDGKTESKIDADFLAKHGFLSGGSYAK